MKERSYKQMMAIEGKTPQETAQLFNEAMVSLHRKNPTYQMVSANLFYIFYTERTYEAETKADTYELMGCARRCEECKYFCQHKTKLGNIDNRAKIGTCSLKGGGTFKHSKACDSFYEYLEKREEVKLAKNNKHEGKAGIAL